MAEFNLKKEQYIDYAKQMAKKYNLPQDLFLGQLDQESNWNPKAVSRTGAKGIGQFQAQWHPVGTWKFKTKEDYFDPYKSIESAAMYMNSLKSQYNGNYMAALAHYNGGTEQGKLVAAGKNPTASETANYIPYIQEKAQKYTSQPGVIDQVQNAVQGMAKHIIDQSQPQQQPSAQPAALTDKKQQTMKSLVDYFNKTQNTPQEQPVATRQSPYQQDPAVQEKIAQLQAALSQRDIQAAETNMQAMQHQQMLNQQNQEKQRQAQVGNLAQSLQAFSSPYQATPRPNIGFNPSQTAQPQAQVTQVNPWQGQGRRLN